MNLLAVTPLYPPHSLVGSWMSTHECLAYMVERGHTVTVITSSTSMRRPYDHDGVTVLPAVTKAGPYYTNADLVLSHLGDDQRAARYAKRFRKPVVRMVHGITGGERAKLIQFGDPVLVVCNSQSLADHVGWEGATVVVRPPVDLERCRAEPAGDAIVLVGLSVEKGAAVFYELARRLPNVRFVGVKGGYGSQVVVDLPNVEVREMTPDMASVYAEARLVLMPSVVETFGRVGLEAMCSGIPVVAHPTPGLVESLGDAAVFVDRADVDGWEMAVRRSRQPTEWARLSRLSSAHAARFDRMAELNKFAVAIEGAVG